MKYAVALFIMTIPAVLAAKDSCPMDRQAFREVQAAVDLTATWQISPLLSDQVL